MTDRVLGSFRHGHFPDVFLEATADIMNVQLTKAHEGVHRVLEYSSAHGLLLTFLIGLSRKEFSHPQLSEDIVDLIRLLYGAEFHVQEGCATFLTLNMCMAGFGKPQADRLAERMPGDYRVATALVSDCLGATRGNSALGPLVIKNMEFLIHGIALASLNSNICVEFRSPDSLTTARLRSYLQANAPTVRLHHIRQYLSNPRHVEAYVRACADAVTRAEGDFPIYDQNFMREYLAKHPLEWEERHKRLDFEMRRQLVSWFSQKGVIDIDPSYDFHLSDLSRWAPVVLIREWEAQLGARTGLLDSLEWQSATSIERHVAVVHSIKYTLEDRRRVLVSRDPIRRSESLVRISRKTPEVIARVLYLPVGSDFPDLGIMGQNRLIVDLAFYRGLTSTDATLRVDGLSVADAQRLLPPSMSCCFMTTQYNYQQAAADDEPKGRGLLGLQKIHVFFTPGDFDMPEHIRSSPGPFVLRHSTEFAARREWGENIEVPGTIEIEEQLAEGCRIYFCIADRFLLASYLTIISRLPRVQDHGASVSDVGRRCAIEACYGFDSVLERSSKGVYEL